MFDIIKKDEQEKCALFISEELKKVKIKHNLRNGKYDKIIIESLASGIGYGLALGLSMSNEIEKVEISES